MRILLIYPQYPETFWSLKYALKFNSKKAALPPLGLMTVAAMLPRDWERKLVDMNVAPLTDAQLEWADFAFISAMSVQGKSAREVIDRCRKKELKIVAGGPLFTTQSSDFEMLVDHLVLGEAEGSFAPFLADLLNGSARKIYKCEGWPDIRQSPTPEWSLIDVKNYDSIGIQYSRGCPFNCEFCDILILNGQTPRQKSKEQILEELETLYQRGWRDGVFFVDDNFIGNRGILKKELLPALVDWIKKRDYPFHFFTETSINLADDEVLMQLMGQAGFNKVFVGIESPHEESLAECNKFHNQNRDMVASVKKMQNHGFEVMGGFIIGFDNDPPSIFEKQIQFIQKSGIITAMVGLLMVFRGTPLYKRMETENRLLDDTTGNNTDLSLNFIPKMNKELLVNGYRDVIKTIYAPREYYKRVITFMKEFKPFPNRDKKTRIAPNELLAFARTVWHLGIKNNGRLYYWKLLTWTVLRRPNLFGKAVTYAIMGFHFRKMFKLQMISTSNR